MFNSTKRGFTLIELLVVIAIIGILSSVVLAALNSARGKGANAAVKANLTGIRSQAGIYYDNGGNTYTGLCTDPTVANALATADVAGGGTAVCNDADLAWAASTALKVVEDTDKDFWCVDSFGNSKGETAALGAGVTVCP